MGYELRRWLADRLPSEVSSGERLLALEIADLANDRTRRAFGNDTLAKLLHRSGFADMKQVGKVLGKLAGRGLELRAPILGKDGQPVRDKLGRPVFAAKGHGLEFVVPTADCPALRRSPAWGIFNGPPDGGSSDSSPSGGSFDGGGASSAPQSSPVGETFESEGPPAGVQRSPAGSQSSPAWSSKVPLAGGPSPQGSPQVTSSLSGDAPESAREEEREDLDEENHPQAEPVQGADRFTARLMAEHSATADEVTAVLAAASRDGIRNVSAWSASTVGRDDFARRLAELRTKPAPRQPSACGHSDADDPENPGTCLLCKITAKRLQKQTPPPQQEDPVVPEAEDAEARARLAEFLARGRAEREKRERQKQERNKPEQRRPVRLAAVLSPKMWEEREGLLQRQGYRGLPEVEAEPGAEAASA